MNKHTFDVIQETRWIVRHRVEAASGLTGSSSILATCSTYRDANEIAQALAEKMGGEWTSPPAPHKDGLSTLSLPA